MADHQSYALLTRFTSDGTISVRISESRLSEDTRPDGTVTTDIFVLVSKQVNADFFSLMRPDSAPPSTPAFGEWNLYMKDAKIDAETYRSMSRLAPSTDGNAAGQTSGTEGGGADRQDTAPPESKTDLDTVTDWFDSLNIRDVAE